LWISGSGRAPARASREFQLYALGLDLRAAPPASTCATPVASAAAGVAPASGSASELFDGGGARTPAFFDCTPATVRASIMEAGAGEMLAAQMSQASQIQTVRECWRQLADCARTLELPEAVSRWEELLQALENAVQVSELSIGDDY
jgi:hypothetical protein